MIEQPWSDERLNQYSFRTTPQNGKRTEGATMTTTQLTLQIIVKILLVPFLTMGFVIGFIYVALNIGFWNGVEYLEQKNGDDA